MVRMRLYAVAAALVLLSVVVLLRLHWGDVTYRQIRSVRRLDHAALLADCRLLMQRGAFASDGYIVLKPPYGADVPSRIRELRPQLVRITHEMVDIKLSYFNRVSVLAFAPDARGFGTERLIDGLWLFWGPIHSGDSGASP